VQTKFRRALRQISMETVAVQKTTIVTRTRDHLACELQDETVILHVSKGTYYGLNPTGGALWKYLEEPRTVAELEAFLLERYEVTAQRCSQDVQELLAQLLTEELVELNSQGAVNSQANAG